MFCENCGSPIPEDSKFCLSCGAKTAGAQSGGQALQETAVVTDAIQVDTLTAVDTVKPEAEPIQNEPQPKPVPPAAQARPVQPAPQPEPTRYAPPQPAPQAQTYQQPIPQAQTYQQPIPQAQSYQQPSAIKIEKVNPLPIWKYMGMMLLTGIPIIGFIMILVWSFGSSFNKNTRNYARAVLILGIIGFVLAIVTLIVNWAMIQYLIDNYNSIYQYNMLG